MPHGLRGRKRQRAIHDYGRTRRARPELSLLLAGGTQERHLGRLGDHRRGKSRVQGNLRPVGPHRGIYRGRRTGCLVLCCQGEQNKTQRQHRRSLRNRILGNARNRGGREIPQRKQPSPATTARRRSLFLCPPRRHRPGKTTLSLPRHPPHTGHRLCPVTPRLLRLDRAHL